MFCLVSIQYPGKHKEDIEAFKYDFEQLGIIIDKNCGDVTRLRLISYDANYYLNENAEVYSKLIEKTKVPTLKNSNTHFMKSHDINPGDPKTSWPKVQKVIAE